jgi:hypothetical protein
MMAEGGGGGAELKSPPYRNGFSPFDAMKALFTIRRQMALPDPSPTFRIWALNQLPRRF